MDEVKGDQCSCKTRIESTMTSRQMRSEQLCKTRIDDDTNDETLSAPERTPAVRARKAGERSSRPMNRPQRLSRARVPQPLCSATRTETGYERRPV